ncbi:hypothetical protein ACPV5G_20005 [Photobacterium damselae]|uniref:hypothetical protein n=1 Tax=Photobacterium damselae TaxID=38293 RepID=UPI00406955DB
MARERSFTEQQIINAVSQLIIDGKNINGTSLRNQIGVGRPTALMSAYEELKEKGLIETPQLDVVESTEIKHQVLPPEIADQASVMLADIERMIHSINDHAHFTVEQRLNNAINEANVRASEAAKREADSLEQQNKAFEQLEDALDDIDELTEKMGLIQQEMNQLKTQYELSENNRQNAEQANTELKRQINVNEEQLSELQSKNQELEQKNTQLNTQLISAQKEIDSLNANAISSAQTVQNLEKLNAKLEGQLQLTTSSLDQAKQELTNSSQTILSLEKLKTEHTTLINSMQNAVKEKNKELEGQRVRIDRLIEENTNLIRNTPM